MIEILEKRDFIAKHFDIGNKQLAAEIHAGPIHYRDKFGDGSYKDVDFTLSYEAGLLAWTFTANNFHPRIPQYSNGPISFRDLYHNKDRTIALQAIGVNKVHGQLFANIPGITEANAIIYPDAFGIGRDLVLCFQRSGLKKLIRIRAGYYGASDESFDFKITLPQENIYFGKNRFDPTKAHIFDSGERLSIGPNIGNENELTYIQPFVAWDDKKRPEIIPAEFYINSGLYLRKTIPAAFFSTAVGDIWLDATTLIQIIDDDGFFQNSACAAWDTAHDAAAGDYFSNAMEIGAQRCTSDILYIFAKGYVDFDTSGIGAGATITAAVTSLYGTGAVKNHDNDGTDYITLVEGQAGIGSPPIGADFDLVGDSIDNPTEGVDAGNRIDVGSWDTGGYNAFTHNATGLTWIDPTDDFRAGFREGHDTTDDPLTLPLGNWQGNWVAALTSETAGTAQDPKVFVTYTPAGGLSIPVAMHHYTKNIRSG